MFDCCIQALVLVSAHPDVSLCTDNAPPSYDPVVPTSYDPVGPTSYNPVGPSSYGTVDYDAYSPQHPQTTTFAAYPTYETGYQQQPVYTTTTTAAVTTQPGGGTFRPPKPSSHLWLSVFTMLCCCFILGLIAIIVGMEVCLCVCVGGGG